MELAVGTLLYGNRNQKCRKINAGHAYKKKKKSNGAKLLGKLVRRILSCG